jgi:hypothetical protein
MPASVIGSGFSVAFIAMLGCRMFLERKSEAAPREYAAINRKSANEQNRMAQVSSY